MGVGKSDEEDEMARTGRPPIGDTFRRIRMTSRQVDDLRLVAALEGISAAEAIRRAVDEYIERVRQDSGAA